MRSCLRALAGLLLVFAVHIPRLVYRLLLVSYAYVFNRNEGLTADPKEHLRRARRLLKGQNSQLLYAALELRLASEGMTFHALALAERASNKALKDNDPGNRIAVLHGLDADSRFPHRVYLVDRSTGKRYDWGQYVPLDKRRMHAINHGLDNLLHAKPGLNLGIASDPWYSATRRFLVEALSYLEGVAKDNTPFFAFEGLDHVEMVKEDSA